jgi:hypothetical protein
MRRNERTLRVGDRVIALITLEPIQRGEEGIVKELLDRDHAYDYKIYFPSFAATDFQAEGALINEHEVMIAYDVEREEAIAVLGEDYFA